MLAYQIPTLSTLAPDWWYTLLQFFNKLSNWVIDYWPYIVGLSVVVLLAGIIVKILL